MENSRLNFSNSNPMNNPAFLSNMNPLLGTSNKENEPRPLKDPTKSPLFGNKDSKYDVTEAYKKTDFTKKLKNPTFGEAPTAAELQAQLGQAAIQGVGGAAGQKVATEIGKKVAGKGTETAITNTLGTTSNVLSNSAAVAKSAASMTWNAGANAAIVVPKVATPVYTIAGQGAGKALSAVEPAGKLVDFGSKAGSGATTAATSTGKEVGKAAAKGAGGMSNLASAGVSLGVGLLGTGMDIYGGHLQKKAESRDDLKGYTGAQTLKWAGKGVSWGSTIGSVIPGVGTLVGAAVGGALGAIGGAIGGSIQKKKILRTRENEKNAVAKQNQEIEERNRILAGRTQDLVNNQRYMQDTENLMLQNARIGGPLLAGRYIEPQTKRLINKVKPAENTLSSIQIFKLGGSLKKSKEQFIDFASLQDDQKEEYLAEVHSLSEEGADIKTISTKTKLHPKVVYALQKYLSEQQKETVEYKRGGRVRLMKKNVASCACGCTPKFRRGGQLEVEKQNVIIDGPTHDELNKTGVKGDKGLPVVKIDKDGKAFKVAEIERNELVLNKKATEVLASLRKKLNSSNEDSDEYKKVKLEIADLLQTELKDNTYDYSNLMS